MSEEVKLEKRPTSRSGLKTSNTPQKRSKVVNDDDEEEISCEKPEGSQPSIAQVV